jgi:hypothetical protein
VLSEKEEKLTIPDLKNLIVAKIENLIFQVAELIYEKNGFEAMELLQVTFPLLPPVIRGKLEAEENRVKNIIKHCLDTTSSNLYMTMLTQNDEARAHLPEIQEILGKIQKLMFDYYLEVGYRGLDLSKEAKRLDLEESEE